MSGDPPLRNYFGMGVEDMWVAIRPELRKGKQLTAYAGMKPEYHDQTSVQPLYLMIPLEVALDHSLSDGAILLFAEIFTLQHKYGSCFASDGHLMQRRGKGRSTVQRQIAELTSRGHMSSIAGKKHSRELVVASKYQSPRKRDMKEAAKQAPKSETADQQKSPKNENGGERSNPKNETQKNPESNKNPESRTTLSRPIGSDASAWISEEGRLQVLAAVRALDDTLNLTEYLSLWQQSFERGRLDAWEAALASTIKAKNKSGHLQKCPVAYFRSTLINCWGTDRQYLSRKLAPISPDTTLAVRMGATYGHDGDPNTSPTRRDSPQVSHPTETRAEAPSARVSDSDQRSGQATNLSAYTPPKATGALGFQARLQAFLDAVPVELRAALLEKAIKNLRERRPKLWADSDGKAIRYQWLLTECRCLFGRQMT